MAFDVQYCDTTFALLIVLRHAQTLLTGFGIAPGFGCSCLHSGPFLLLHTLRVKGLTPAQRYVPYVLYMPEILSGSLGTGVRDMIARPGINMYMR